MRRIAKIIVIATIILVAFLMVCYIFPDVKAAVDSAVGPNITGAFSAVGATIAPLYAHYVAPWPNHAIAWVAIALVFALIFHKGFNRVRTVFVRSADRESGRTVVMDGPISTATTPPPISTEKKNETTEPKPSEEK